jgi:hypothetical protein
LDDAAGPQDSGRGNWGQSFLLRTAGQVGSPPISPSGTGSIPGGPEAGQEAATSGGTQARTGGGLAVGT